MNRYSIGSIVSILLPWELAARGLGIPKHHLSTASAITSYMIVKFQLLASHPGDLVGSWSRLHRITTLTEKKMMTGHVAEERK